MLDLMEINIDKTASKKFKKFELYHDMTISIDNDEFTIDID